MARLKEFSIIELDTWFNISLYTVLEERAEPKRLLLRTLDGETARSLSLTEKEDAFIRRMEQTGICLIDNRKYDSNCEDCGSWYVHICYDDKEIAACGFAYIPEEVREVLKLTGTELYRGPSGWDRPDYHVMTELERIYCICLPRESIRMQGEFRSRV